MASCPASARIGLHHSVLDPDGVSETLKCPVCMEVFEDPVFCGGRPCQHVFCQQCIERALEVSEQCPVCREYMLAEDLHPHQVIRSLLDEVTVVCEHQCGWTGRRDAVSAHLAVCPVLMMKQAHERLEAQSQRFAGVDRQLIEKDARIAELEALVAEKDRLVVSTGQEVVKRQLQIAELENRCAKTTHQLFNCRQQLDARDTELERLRGSTEGGARSSHTGRPATSYISPSPGLQEGCELIVNHNSRPDLIVDVPKEDSTRAYDLEQDLASPETREDKDAWLDPAGYLHEDYEIARRLQGECISSLVHESNPDESAEEPML